MSEFTVKDIKSIMLEGTKGDYIGIYNPESFWETYGNIYLGLFDNKEDNFRLNVQPLISRIYNIKPKSILEVGCGFGRNIPFIKGNVPGIERFVGLEFSKTMLDKSEEYFKVFKSDEFNPNEVELINADARDMPFEDNAFDLVYTHVCLTHIPPKYIKQVTEEIARVSKKWIIHFERFNYMYEHPNQHRWSHCLPPFYLCLDWELWEQDIVNKKHFTNAIVFKKN